MTIRAGLFAAAAMLFSLAFACAAPFAALAAVAAMRLPAREALFTLLLAWIANQAIGYGLLDYPVDASSIGWGIALGIAALASGAAALALRDRLYNSWLRLGGGFVAAFVANQAVLYLLGLGLPGSEGAFTYSIIMDVLRVNLLGLAVLTALMLAAGLAEQRLARKAA